MVSVKDQAAAADPDSCCQSRDKHQETGPHHTGPQITALASCESQDTFQNLTEQSWTKIHARLISSL